MDARSSLAGARKAPRAGGARPAQAQVEWAIERLIEAPCDRVYEAWTNPRLMALWWGPKDFTNPVCEMDVRPGGAFRFGMRSPDGVDYPVTGVIDVVEPPVRLVFAIDGHEARRRTPMTVTFAESAGRTRLRIVHRFPTAADCEASLLLGAEKGWSHSLDRLEALIERPTQPNGGCRCDSW